MNQTKSKYGIIIALLFIVGGLLTCQFSGHKEEENPAGIDTALLRAWKNEKENLILNQESKLRRLSQKQDSLCAEISEKKKLLNRARSKAVTAEQELYELLAQADTDFIATDSIEPLIVSFSEACHQSDSLCGEAIRVLEEQVESKDSSLIHQAYEITLLKQITSQQDIQINSLSESLQAEMKSGRRLIRRNRWLSAGACLLAGISTSLLITRNLR